MISKNQLKFIKSLKIKKYRVREKRFLVEGAKNVLELVKSDYQVDDLLCTELFYASYEKVLAGLGVEIVSEKVLASIGSFKSNDACLAVAKTKDLQYSKLEPTDHVFALDGISDPGNLGTIIRTLDWFGFNNIICSMECAEFYNPKVISSSMGSFTRTNISYSDLPSILSEMKLPCIGAEMNGKSLFESSFQNAAVFVMGNESNGITNEVKRLLDHSINIPSSGEAESLNVGVATGIIAAYLRM